MSLYVPVTEEAAVLGNQGVSHVLSSFPSWKAGNMQTNANVKSNDLDATDESLNKTKQLSHIKNI